MSVQLNRYSDTDKTHDQTDKKENKILIDMLFSIQIHDPKEIIKANQDGKQALKYPFVKIMKDI